MPGLMVEVIVFDEDDENIQQLRNENNPCK